MAKSRGNLRLFFGGASRGSATRVMHSAAAAAKLRGIDVIDAETTNTVAILKRRPDAVLVDIKLPDRDKGARATSQAKRSARAIERILAAGINVWAPIDAGLISWIYTQSISCNTSSAQRIVRRRSA